MFTNHIEVSEKKLIGTTFVIPKGTKIKIIKNVPYLVCSVKMSKFVNLDAVLDDIIKIIKEHHNSDYDLTAELITDMFPDIDMWTLIDYKF